MIKNDLRKNFRSRRDSLSYSEVEKMQDRLLINFQQLDLPYVSFVHFYLPKVKGNEPDPYNLIRWLSFKNPGMVCAVPVTDFINSEMKHVVYDDNTTLQVNSFGIPEPTNGKELDPTDFDLVLAPLLAFDLNGYRVGYGKGFYDRFLSKCKDNVICVGLSFFDPVDKIEDTDNFDRKMDYCVTPERIYEF